MSKALERTERFVLYSVICFLYGAPLKFYIFSMHTIPSMVYFIVSSFVTSMALIYITLCLYFRGFVTLREPQKKKLCLSALRTCNICMQPKPERSHHCSQCRRCIKKMDHHCHWLGRCINYDNHGHFIRFLFFTLLLSVLVFSFNIYYIILSVHLEKTELTRLISAILLTSCLISGILILVTGAHLSSQMFLIMKNTTFLETMQKKNLDLLNKKCGESPYDMGWYENLIDVLGPAKFLFLWMPRGDGIQFQKRWESEYWPKSLEFREDSFYQPV